MLRILSATVRGLTMRGSYEAVIVTYNRIGLLKECMEQVENQTVPAEKIIVVNNASTDGTTEYLQKYKLNNPRYQIVTLAENLGGAGGFQKGMEEALKINADCILLIDDDAIISNDYMERILSVRQERTDYQAFAGSVSEHGSISTVHRRRVSKIGLLLYDCKRPQYSKDYFECDIASFCGMVVDRVVVEKAGLPYGEYFIWCDDTEYSLRLNKYTKFLVIPQAGLNHKTPKNDTNVINNGRRRLHRQYDWREYYGIRNRLFYIDKHAGQIGKLINHADMFINIVFRNWIFGVLKVDGYDWEYEKMLVKEAYRDAKAGEFCIKTIKKCCE